MSTKLEVAKKAINFVAGVGVSKVVNDIIKMNTIIESPSDSAKVWVGSIVIGGMAAETSSRHVNTAIDNAIAWLDKLQSE